MYIYICIRRAHADHLHAGVRLRQGRHIRSGAAGLSLDIRRHAARIQATGGVDQAAHTGTAIDPHLYVYLLCLQCLMLYLISYSNTLFTAVLIGSIQAPGFSEKPYIDKNLGNAFDRGNTIPDSGSVVSKGSTSMGTTNLSHNSLIMEPNPDHIIKRTSASAARL